MSENWSPSIPRRKDTSNKAASDSIYPADMGIISHRTLLGPVTHHWQNMDNIPPVTDNQSSNVSVTAYVPYEILREIFIHCVNENIVLENANLSCAPWSDYHTSLDLNNSPWTLSHVCQRWRDVAVSFPRLWSNVSVLLLHGRNTSAITSLLRLQLERSKDHLLSISLLIHPQIQVPHNDALLCLFLSTSVRWEVLHLHIPQQTLISLDTATLSLPSLHTLGISPVGLLPDFREAPKLVYFVGIPSFFLNIPPAWLSQITSMRQAMIRAVSVSTGECLRVLSLLPNLEECSILCANSPFSQFLSLFTFPMPIHHSSLQRLVLQAHSNFRGHEAASELLQELTAPNLEYLDITGVVDVSILLQFVKLSECPLRSLKLSATGITVRECYDLLMALPKLRSFALLSSELYSNQTKKLLEMLHETDLVRSLQYLYLDLAVEFWDKSIVDGLMSKLQAARPGLTITHVPNQPVRHRLRLH